MSKVITIGCVLLLASACGDGPSDTGQATDSGPDSADPCTLDPIVSIGTGQTEYIALEEGDPVMMVHGPQGGWHMLGSVRVEQTTQVVRVYYTVTDEASGAVVVDNEYQVALVMDGECSGYFPGMYGYLNVDALKTAEATTPPELLSEHTLEMHMRIVDRKDGEGEAALLVTAVPDPKDVDGDTGSAGSE